MGYSWLLEASGILAICTSAEAFDDALGFSIVSSMGTIK